MKRYSLSLIVGLALVGLLSGCGGAKVNNVTPAPAASQEVKRPPLVIPASFVSLEEKKSFAIKSIDEGYYAEAKPLLEEVLAMTPDVQGLEKLGTAHYNLGEFDEAISAWSQATERDPKVAAAMANFIGNAQRDARRYPEAEASYRRALTLDPTEWHAAVNLATMLRAQHKSQEAMTVLEQALDTNREITPLSHLLEVLKGESKAS